MGITTLESEPAECDFAEMISLKPREKELLKLCAENHGMELDLLVNQFWFEGDYADKALFFRELEWELRRLYMMRMIDFAYFGVWEPVPWKKISPLASQFRFDDRIRWMKDQVGGWHSLIPLDFGQKLNVVLAEKGEELMGTGRFRSRESRGEKPKIVDQELSES